MLLFILITLLGNEYHHLHFLFLQIKTHNDNFWGNHLMYSSYLSSHTYHSRDFQKYSIFFLSILSISSISNTLYFNGVYLTAPYPKNYDIFVVFQRCIFCTHKICCFLFFPYPLVFEIFNIATTSILVKGWLPNNTIAPFFLIMRLYCSQSLSSGIIISHLQAVVPFT